MTETNDYTPQLKKSIEWAKQTRWCVECQTMTPHEEFFRFEEFGSENFGISFMKSEYVCGFCGTTEETK